MKSEILQQQIDTLNEKLNELQVQLAEAKTAEAKKSERDREFAALEAHVAAFNDTHGENYKLWREPDDEPKECKHGCSKGNKHEKPKPVGFDWFKPDELEADEKNNDGGGFIDLVKLIDDLLG